MSDLHTKIHTESGFVLLKIGDIKIEDGYVKIPAKVAKDIGCDLISYAQMASEGQFLERANEDLDDAREVDLDLEVPVVWFDAEPLEPVAWCSHWGG